MEEKPKEDECTKYPYQYLVWVKFMEWFKVVAAPEIIKDKKMSNSTFDKVEKFRKHFIEVQMVPSYHELSGAYAGVNVPCSDPKKQYTLSWFNSGNYVKLH